MNIENYLPFLRSPIVGSELVYDNQNLKDKSNNIFPIINSIPRFVEQENYAGSFGFQWNKFQQTQVDRYNDNTITKERFYQNTSWTNQQLKGKKLLEAGSGAGRFTEVLIKTGAELFSIDYSNAVEANWKNNGGGKDFFLAQADIYNLPFRKELFDYIFCFGVIQHTPDVRATFFSLIKFLKPGGEIALDVYPLTWKSAFNSKYWVRPITKKMSKKGLLKIIEWYVPKWLPVSSILLKIPYAGKFLAQIIPIRNYSIQYPLLKKKELLEWAILDTFDNLSPAHDHPQTLRTLERWAKEANLKILYCGKGDNGYILRAKKII